MCKYRAFASLLGEDDLLVNHDRTSCMLPTQGDGKEDFAVTSFLHLDMDPWEYMRDKSSTSREDINYNDLKGMYQENNAVHTPHTQMHFVIFEN